MKRIICSVLAGALLLCGCADKNIAHTTVNEPTSAQSTHATHEFEYVTFDAKVMQRTGDSLLLGDLGDTVGSIFYLTTDDDTIKAGDIVEVTFNGMIMESYPLQLGEPSFKLKEQGTSVLPMLEELYHELWERDRLLNEDLDVIAVDFEKISVLSDIEKEAFLKILDNYMYSNHDIGVIESNFEKLKEENLIKPYGDIENAYHFENGLLISFESQEDTSIPLTSFTMSITKWRSPLGAYGINIIAKLDGNQWKYEIESEFMA